MRPHHIRLAAFGPFPGTVEVDLDRLGASGLFLLHGPTGAGKTTLLDAMCFALYGRVPGARGTSRLRSDHAPADAVCEVSLELTVTGRRLRVTRSPAHVRPKKRGTGTTTEPATARLEELRSSRWSVTSTRPDEVGAELQQLLGMSAEQFWQVVLLPQGQFADFLRADARERGELLEALFATDRFGHAEEWLKGRRSDLDQQVGRAGADARSLAARIAEAAGARETLEPDTAWYESLLTAAAAASAAAAQDVVGADAGVARTAQALRATDTLADRQRRRRGAIDTLAALTAQADGVAVARDRLAAARRAAPVLPVAERAASARRSAACARAVAEAAAAAAVLLAPDAARVDCRAADLRVAAEAARTRLGRLDALSAQEDRLTQADSRLAAADDRLVQIAAELTAHDEQRAVLPGMRAAAESSLADARAAAADLPAARLRVEQQRALADDDRRRQAARGRVGSAATADAVARESALAAGEHHLAVRQALLAGQAARLAADLVAGEPCAVCGSSDHPAPATGGDLVQESRLQSAETALATAQEERRRTAAELATVTAELAGLEQRLAGWTDDLAAAATELTALETRAAALADAEASAAELVDRDRALATTGARLLTEQIGLAAARAAAATDAAADRRTLEAALDGAPDLASAVAATTACAGALDAAAETAAAADRGEADARAVDAKLTQALSTQGFGSLEALGDAAADDPAELAALLEAYDAELAAARATLADPELAVPLDPAADPATAGAEHDAAQRGATVLTRIAAVAAERHRAVASHGPAFRSALASLAPLRAERDVVAGLADLCGGRNALGMTLTTYVLAARLEQVAAAASRRLTLMTDGRYTLRHTDERRDGRKRSGLGLVVHDAWTGQPRDTGTLSGGETFVASLALALGLADTVTAEAGGAPIEALFVDEGFGTLDADTLDEVMDVLDGLRAGGRVVGLVSHVAELRQRIPTQLRVHKHHDGSTLEIVA